jgi:hypothetical protein
MITGDLVIGYIPERVKAFGFYIPELQFRFVFFLKRISGVRWCNLFSGEIGHFAGGFCFSICVFFVTKNLDGLMMVDARKQCASTSYRIDIRHLAVIDLGLHGT